MGRVNREPDTFRLAAAQHSCRKEQRWNLQQGVQAIEQAASREVDLLLLPELHGWSYFCIHRERCWFDAAEPVPGRLTEELGMLAHKHGLIVVTTVFERCAEGKFYNTAVVLDRDGSLAGCYRKMHIPDDPGYHEKFYFSPGDQGFVPIQTSLCRLGVLVCWDQWFPEAARLMALADADLLLFPSAIGWDPHDAEDEKERQLQAWITVQRGHAIANALPVVVSNRTGVECGPASEATQTCFWGTSFIAGQQGEILAIAGADETELVVAEVRWSRTSELRRVWPFFRDRRVAHYQALLSPEPKDHGDHSQ